MKSSGALNVEDSIYYQDLKLEVVGDGEQQFKKRNYEIKAVTGEIDRRHPLRHLKRRGNRIELAICITMYNEEIAELQDTMYGVVQSVSELCSKKLSCDQIAVFLIADGLDKVPEDFLRQGESIGFFKRRRLLDHGYLEEQFDKNTNSVKYKALAVKENILHCFQTRIKNFGFDEKRQSTLHRDLKIVHPINFFFGIKHNNGGKLDSHLYFFRGFCGYLRPKYCTLVDIGTQPLGGAIHKIYDFMEKYPDVGGSCGEIEVDVKNFSPFSISNLLVAAQYVEYKVSHFLDKAFESLFGFVSVLPGAFCTFRYSAIEGDPLEKYFEGLDKEAPDFNCFKANMYLAEDRIMCLEILIKRRQKSLLRYVPGVKAKTDPPKDINIFIRQRRRWINGSNFASLYVLINFKSIHNSAHAFFRKIFILLLFIYYFINTILTFAMVGTFYVAFNTLVSSKFPDDGSLFSASTVMSDAYIVMLFLTLVLAICKDVDHAMLEYKVIIIVFGFFMGFTLYTSLYYFLLGTNTSIIQYILIAGIAASYIVPFMLNFCSVSEPLAFVFGMAAYLFLTPMYVNVFVIYAFCNIHDVSWGNRASSHGAQKKDTEFKSYRTNILIIWLLFNLAIGYFMNYVNTSLGKDSNIMLYISLYVGGVLYVKLVGSAFHRFKHLLEKCLCRKRKKVNGMNIVLPNKPEAHVGLFAKEIELFI